MAHHVFRRCLLADVVPPAVPYIDDRLAIGSHFAIAVSGVVLSTSVVGLDVMGELRVSPIPPAVETGESVDRSFLALRYYSPILIFPGLDLWGSASDEDLS